jgi:type IV pilus assembly protein PilQ
MRFETMKRLRERTLGPALLLTVLAGSSQAMAQQDENVPILLETQTQQSTTPEFIEGVRVTEFGTVEIGVQNADLRSVLQTLAIRSGRNIVASETVTANVTANIEGVSLERALEVLLDQYGYGFVVDGEFIRVYSRSELDARRPFRTEVFHLEHLTAEDAAQFAGPLLSAEGRLVESVASIDWGLYTGSGSGVSQGTGGGGGGGGGTSSPGAPFGKDSFAHRSMIMVRDYDDNIKEIASLFKLIDTSPDQVLIEATVVSVVLTDQNAFGVDFALIQDVQFTEFFGLPSNFTPDNRVGRGADDLSRIATQTNAPNDGFLSTNIGNQSGPAGIRGGIMAGDSAIFIRALDTISDANIMANPKVLALNRQQARVFVGSRVGYLQTVATETATTQTVEFIDTGIQLAVRPFVSSDGRIRMELAPRIADVVFNQRFSDGRAFDVPTENIQEITTNVTVPEGSTVVLGGLFQESISLTRSQIPLLGDIPLIGGAFRGSEDTTLRQEVMFLIKPTIIRDSKLIDDGDRASAEAARVLVGTREGLLPWARERQTSVLNVDAQRMARDGDLDRAMWTVRRSLELHPAQADAIRIREQLITDQTKAPTRSMMERAMNNRILNLLSESEKQERQNLRSTQPQGWTPPPPPPSVQPENRPAPQPAAQQAPQTESKPEPKPESKTEPQAAAKPAETPPGQMTPVENK